MSERTPQTIVTSHQAFRQLQHLGRLEVEEFWVLALHANKRLIGMERIFRGTVDACPVFPRDVFRAACRWNASSLIIAHNHPSGDARPSAEDLAITQHLCAGGRLLGIPLVDHLVIAGAEFWSFADHGFDF
ncbi:MAG: RadC family protein [Bdellovibrionales bacterium]